MASHGRELGTRLAAQNSKLLCRDRNLRVLFRYVLLGESRTIGKLRSCGNTNWGLRLYESSFRSGSHCLRRMMGLNVNDLFKFLRIDNSKCSISWIFGELQNSVPFQSEASVAEMRYHVHQCTMIAKMECPRFFSTFILSIFKQWSLNDPT